jgi:hypothetical protein
MIRCSGTDWKLAFTCNERTDEVKEEGSRKRTDLGSLSFVIPDTTARATKEAAEGLLRVDGSFYLPTGFIWNDAMVYRGPYQTAENPEGPGYQLQRPENPGITQMIFRNDEGLWIKDRCLNPGVSDANDPKNGVASAASSNVSKWRRDKASNAHYKALGRDKAPNCLTYPKKTVHIGLRRPHGWDQGMPAVVCAVWLDCASNNACFGSRGSFLSG